MALNRRILFRCLHCVLIYSFLSSLLPEFFEIEQFRKWIAFFGADWVVRTDFLMVCFFGLFFDLFFCFISISILLPVFILLSSLLFLTSIDFLSVTKTILSFGKMHFYKRKIGNKIEYVLYYTCLFSFVSSQLPSFNVWSTTDKCR